MLLRFFSPHNTEVTMLDKHAKQVLAAMGRVYGDEETLPERSAIPNTHLAEAIMNLKNAIALQEREADLERLDDEYHHDDPFDDKVYIHPIDEDVSLACRAWPLLNMLETALKYDEHVSWEQVSPWQV